MADKKNTGKAPSIQFYYKDWQTDLEDYPIEIEGAWLRVCNRIWHNHRDTGRITRTKDEWAIVWNVSATKVDEIVHLLRTRRIAGVTVRNNKVTLKCWRVARDAKLREDNRLRQAKHRGKQACNADVTSEIPPPSTSTSFSSSPSGINTYTLEEVLAQAITVGMTDEQATEFYHQYNAQGWKYPTGLPIEHLGSAMAKWRNNQHKFDKPDSSNKTKKPDFKEAFDLEMEKQDG